MALAALLAALVTMGSGSADAGDAYPQLIEQGSRIDSLGSLGNSGLAALDIDGDGTQEVVFGARAGGQPVLAVLDAQSDGSFRIVHEHVVFPDDLVRVLAWMPDGQPRVLTVGGNGIVREYAAPPFVEMRRFQTQPRAVAAALGDVDGDGHQNLVVLTPTAVHAYALANGQLVRSYPAAGFTDLVLAQLDADPALEIILTSDSAGLVLDGATSATEWERPGGFGRRLTAGRFGPDGAMRWAGATWSDATVFAPWTATWTVSPALGVQGIGHAAYGPDSDVLVVEEYGGTLSVYDEAQQLRFRFTNEGASLSSISAADFDGDGQSEIVYSSSQAWSDMRSLGIVDVGTGQLLGGFVFSNGPYIRTAIGDVDGDGREEIAAAAFQYTGSNALALFDLATGLPKWKSPYYWPSTHPLSSTIIDVALVPRNLGVGSDLVLLDTQGSLRIIDGTTLEQTLRVAGASGESAADLALIDYDKDGIQDFVIAGKAGATSGGQLKVLSGRDGTLLWRSVHMGGMSTTISQVLVADASPGGGRRQLIAVLSDGLRAYDVDSGLLDWVLDVAYAGASYVRNGASGPELITFSQSGQIQFYDVTHSGVEPALQRQYLLPAPLKAVTPVDDDVRLLLVAAGDRLVLVNGITGELMASSPPIAPFSSLIAGPLSVIRQSANTWQVVAGTEVALYRYRLVLGEAIFSDGLDGL